MHHYSRLVMTFPRACLRARYWPLCAAIKNDRCHPGEASFGPTKDLAFALDVKRATWNVKRLQSLPMSDTARTALVTGASQGIGRACAIALAQAGHSVACCARHEEELTAVIQ